MKNAILALLFLLCTVVLSAEEKKEDHYSRGIVIQALEVPNKLGVSGREFTTKENPKGEGVFVYDSRTKIAGVERFLIWIVIEDSAYPLSGPSKTITPSLKWPREADPAVWKKTGLDPYWRKRHSILFSELSNETRSKQKVEPRSARLDRMPSVASPSACSIAHLVEAPGAVVPHAGICEGAAR